MASTITFSGLSSGLDTSSWIEALVSVKQTTITQLQTANSVQESLLNVVSNIKSFFTSFQTCLQKITDASFGINSMDLFMQNIASSTNLNIATATATTEAARQSYEVLVEKLATTTKAQSGITKTESVRATLDTKLGQLGVSDGTITVNSKAFGISENDTIKSLIEKFSNVGVVASFNEKNSKFTVSFSVGEIDDGTTGLKNALKLEDRTITGLISGSINYVNRDTNLADLGLTEGDIVINGKTCTIDHLIATLYSMNIPSDPTPLPEPDPGLGGGLGRPVLPGHLVENLCNTVGQFLNILKNNLGAEEADIDDYGNITIKGCSIESVVGGSNLKEILGLTESPNVQTFQSGVLTYNSAEFATRDTLLTDLGITEDEEFFMGASISVYGLSTLGDLFEALHYEMGISADIVDGVIISSGVRGLSDSAIAKLGLVKTGETNTYTSSVHSVVTSNTVSGIPVQEACPQNISLDTTLEDLSGSGMLGYSININNENHLFTKLNTLEDLKSEIIDHGGTFTINPDNTVTIEGVNVSGTLADKLGLTALSESTSFSGNTLYTVLSTEVSGTSVLKETSSTTTLDSTAHSIFTGGSNSAMSLGELINKADSNDLVIADSEKLSKAQAEAQGYTWVTTASALHTALQNNEKICLGANISLASVSSSWNVETFSGELNGNGYTLSNLTLNKSTDNVGLIGNLSGTVKNLKLTGFSITSTGNNIGALAGYADSDANVTNVAVVNSYIEGSQNVAGVIGNVYGCTLNNVYNSSTVKGTSYVGGIEGSAMNTVKNVYNSGSISGTSRVGGCIGYAYSGTCNKMYNSGTVTGTSTFGGIIGSKDHGSISNYINTNGEADYGSVYSATPANYTLEMALAAKSDATITSLSATNTLAQMGFNDGGLLTLVVDGVTKQYSFDSSDTLQNVIDVLATNNISTAIASNGRLSFTSDSTFSISGGVGNYLTGGNSAVTTTTQTVATALSTLDKLGVNSGSVYIKDENGTVLNTVDIDNSMTLSQAMNAFQAYGITMNIDNGVVSYTTSGNILADGTSNMISALKLDQNYSLNELQERATTGDMLIADFQQLTEAEAIAQGYTWVTTIGDLQLAIINNRKICLGGDLSFDSTTSNAWMMKSNFSGELNGNGYTISNLTKSGSSNLGLISSTTEDAVIKNLKLENFDIDGGSNDRCGALVGFNNGSIDNVSVIGGTIKGRIDVGGIVGKSCVGNITNVSNSANITGTGGDIGGIVGYSESEIINAYNSGEIVGVETGVGGIVGVQKGKDITNAYNDGSVQRSGSYAYSGYYGGIAGKTHGDLTVTNIYNAGAISGRATIGGCIGGSCNGVQTFNNMYNSGTVSADYYDYGAFIGSILNDATVNINNALKTISTKDYYSYAPNPTLNKAGYDLETGLNAKPGVNIGILNSDTTLAQMGFATGGTLKLSVDGTPYTFAFSGTDTMQDILDTLSGYGIDAGVDGSGAFYANAYGHTFNLSGNIGNYLTDGGTYNTQEGGLYTSRNLTTTNSSCANSDSILANLGINSGSVYIKDENGTVLNTVDIDNSMTLSQVMNAFQAYGITMNIDNGVVSYTTSGNILADGTSNMISALKLDQNYSLNELQERATTGDMLIADFQQLTEAEAIAQGYTWVTTINDLQTAINNNRKICLGGDLTFDSATSNAWRMGPEFSGELNGNGYTISNFCKGGYSGLIASTTEDAVIKNLKLENFNLSNGSGYRCGALVGINNGSIDNVSVIGGTISAGYNGGGLVGENYGTISNVSNSATVEGSDFVGGIVSMNWGFIINAYNSGNIIGDSDVGGIVGYSNYNSIISNMYNAGDVSGNYYVGGVIGSTEINGTNLYNSGNVSGTEYIGGVIGFGEAFDPVSIDKIYNTGTVNGTYITGGLIGKNFNNAFILTNCINTSGIDDCGDGSSATQACYDLETGLNTSSGIIMNSITPSTTLAQMGFESGGTIRLVVNPDVDASEFYQTMTDAEKLNAIANGTAYTFDFGANDTVQDIIDTFATFGIGCSINSDGSISCTSNNFYNISGNVGNYLFNKNDGWSFDSAEYKSSVLTCPVEKDFTNDTKLVELGIDTGYINIVRDGNVIGTVELNENTTAKQLSNALKVYGINATIKSVAGGNVWEFSSENNTTIADGTSNLVSELGLNLIDTQNCLNSSGLTVWKDSTPEAGLLTEDTKLVDLDKNATTAIGSLIFTLGSDPTEHIINIGIDDTIGSFIEKLQDKGVNARLVDGHLVIDNGIDGANLVGGTSGIMTTMGFNYDHIAVYSQSSDSLTYTGSVSKSAANFADKDTLLQNLNITTGKMSVYVDNQKVTVNVDSADSFETLFGKIVSAIGTKGVTAQAGFLDEDGNITVDPSLSTGKIGIVAQNGHNIIVGASNDTSNLATIANFSSNDNVVTGDRVLYKVGLDSKITTAGLFQNGTITEGTFTISDAEFTITSDTTIADLVSQINKSDKSYASAYWDSLSGTLVLESTLTGSNLMSIEAGTSNFTNILGLTNNDGSLNTENQQLGGNALVRINGTLVSSASNTITSDVSRINGLTINLKNVSQGEVVTITVEQNKEGVYDAITDVIDSYNSMMAELEKDVETGGSFGHDSILKMMRNNIKRLMTSTIANSGIFKNMSAIGISTGEATNDISTNVTNLVIDKDKFMSALESDSDSVKALLVGNNTQKGVLAQAYNIVTKALSSSGYLSTLEDSIENKIKKNTNKISSLTDALARYRNSLTNKFSNMELIISKLQQSYNGFLTA